MAENLFPENYSDAMQIISPENTNDSYVGYKESIYFDFETEDFLRDGSNKLMSCTGTDAWIQWCIKCLNTPRYERLAYSTDYGIDYNEIFSSKSREEVESNITREVTEALNADPYKRLSYISNIQFEWVDDTTVNILLELVGIDGNTAVVNSTFNAA